MGYSRIQGESIVEDVFTKQGTKCEVLEIVYEGIFKHALTRDNLVVFEDEEFKVWNLKTKEKKSQE